MVQTRNRYAIQENEKCEYESNEERDSEKWNSDGSELDDLDDSDDS